MLPRFPETVDPKFDHIPAFKYCGGSIPSSTPAGTEEIARLAKCPMAVFEDREERTDPLYYRFFKSFLRGSYEGSINAPKLNPVDSQTILTIVDRMFLQ